MIEFAFDTDKIVANASKPRFNNSESGKSLLKTLGDLDNCHIASNLEEISCPVDAVEISIERR